MKFEDVHLRLLPCRLQTSKPFDFKALTKNRLESLQIRHTPLVEVFIFLGRLFSNPFEGFLPHLQRNKHN